MNALAEHPALQTLGWTLLHSLWQLAAIGLLAAAGLRLLRRRGPGIRYALGCAALLLMLAVPAATGWLLLPGADPLGPALAAPAGLVLPTSRFEALRVLLRPLLPWACAAWGLGVAFMNLRLLAGWVYMQRLRRRRAEPVAEVWRQRTLRLAARMGVRGPLTILRSLAVDAPMVIGWLRPVILLPAAALTGLSPAGLEAILAHELEHIRRSDYLVNLLQSVAEALLFYHPAAWWLSRQIRMERENCCDDAAVAICADPVLYADALATLEELRDPSIPNPTLALAATGGILMNRIRRIILPNLAPTSAGRAGLLAILAVSALGAATGLRMGQETPATPVTASAPKAEEPAKPEIRIIRKEIRQREPRVAAEMEAKAKAFAAKAEALAARHEAARTSGAADADLARQDQDLAAMAKDIAEMARAMARREVRELHIPSIHIDGKDLKLPEGIEFETGDGDGSHPIIMLKGVQGDPNDPAQDGQRLIVKHLRLPKGETGELAELKAELAQLKARLDKLAPLAPKPPKALKTPMPPMQPMPPKTPAPAAAPPKG